MLKQSSKIRIGIIGGGGIVKTKHMPGFSKLSHVEVTGICNRSSESSAKFAEEFKVKKIFKTPEELIQSNEIDAVVIGTWPYKHCEYTLKAIDANKHVFVQARMAMNATEAKIMLDAANKKPKIATMICPSPFGFSADLTIRKLMQEKFIGNVLTVRYINLNKFNANAPITWRHKKEFSGENIMAVGIYYETFSRWVGPASEVFAYKTQNVKERPDPDSKKLSKVEIEDDVIITGKLKNGGSFNYHFGFAAHQPTEKIEIFGTEGSIVFHFDQDQLFYAKANAELKPALVDPSLKKDWQVEKNFISQIETGIKQEATFEEGLAYMQFTHAIHESFNKKAMVSIL